MKFLESDSSTEGARVVLFGAPYDGTASFRPGARFGPDAIRAASDGLETYSPVVDHDLEHQRFFDAGDLDLGFGAARPAIDSVQEKVRELLADGVIPFMLGGEHSLTAGAVRACLQKHPELTVVQLDAHADLRTEYQGDPDSHACVMNRCAEAGASLRQVGIRSGTRDEWTRLDNLPFEKEVIKALLYGLEGPIYLTVDIDVFDPSVVPGTGTPEPGGIFWRDFEFFIRVLAQAQLDVVGVDVMELAPKLDPSDVSSVVAAKCVRELLLTL